jgi:hypothetical protein
MPNYTKHMYCIETMRTNDGYQLKSLKADQDGYYSIPFSILGKTLRSGNTYDKEAMLHCTFAPDSRLRQILESAQLISELDHPVTANPPTSADLKRILTLNAANGAAHIGKIWVDNKILNDGTDFIMGKIKPIKPHGAIVEDSLTDSQRNAGVSLRSLVTIRNDGVRVPTCIVTWDVLGSSPTGDLYSTKMYSPESMTVFGKANDVDMTEVINDCIQFPEENQVSIESYINPQLLKYFKSSEVTIHNESVGFILNTPKAIKVMNKLQPQSASYKLLKSLFVG